MSWLTAFVSADRLPWLGDRALDALANELAECCFGEVWQRAGRGAAQCRPAEARGYVAARAAEPIACEVDAELVRRPARFSRRREELIERATAAVVALVLRDVAAISTLADLARAA